jgi:four helix bundle protein
MYQYAFEKLEVWQKAKQLTIFIYGVVKKYPADERFILISQSVRSASSITANLAEGSARISLKDQAHFYTIAYSTAVELLNHIIIAKELKYITNDDYVECRNLVEQVTFGINNLRKGTLAKPSKPSKPSQQ